VIVHGVDDVQLVLAVSHRVTLLSAPGAAGYGGCFWWHMLMRQARAIVPEACIPNVLDCADDSGRALEAMRIGLRGLILERSAPGWDRVADTAAARGVTLLAEAPAAFDMNAIDARCRQDWRAEGHAFEPRQIQSLRAWLQPSGGASAGGTPSSRL
jgi:hypothetical protein